MIKDCTHGSFDAQSPDSFIGKWCVNGEQWLQFPFPVDLSRPYGRPFDLNRKR